MMLDTGYTELLLTHRPAKPRNREELAELTGLLESPVFNGSPAMERFIETLTALILQYEEEIDSGPETSPSAILKYLMDEHNVRQIDLVPLLGSKSYVSQILSGHRPISKQAALKLAEFFHVSPQTFF